MAMIGMRGEAIRMHAVADTPSNKGMMISMKIRSNRVGSALTLLTASEPSHCRASQPGTLMPVMPFQLTATSTVQPI
jgi:hypothetical protein